MAATDDKDAPAKVDNGGTKLLQAFALLLLLIGSVYTITSREQSWLVKDIDDRAGLRMTDT